MTRYSVRVNNFILLIVNFVLLDSDRNRETYIVFLSSFISICLFLAYLKRNYSSDHTLFTSTFCVLFQAS